LGRKNKTKAGKVGSYTFRIKAVDDPAASTCNPARRPPKSPLGQALAYTLPRWEGLSAYALHGQIEIDNNLAENAIRPIAIGRKSFLFAGSHQAAEMTAAIYSFMATCKKNGIDELLWLKDVFERIQSHKQKDLYQLLPNNWEKFRNLEN
jgi:transposase